MRTKTTIPPFVPTRNALELVLAADSVGEVRRDLDVPRDLPGPWTCCYLRKRVGYLHQYVVRVYDGRTWSFSPEQARALYELSNIDAVRTAEAG